MREDIIEKAYAKINISLDVTARRDDGYHDMAMVMQTVSLCDDVRLGFTDGSRIFARTNLPFIPSDERNLAVRAAKKFFEAAGEPERGLCIRIDKRIPVGAGMAGGSTDAAAVLRGLNRAFGNRFGVERLEELGAEVGSDVAFCVRGGTMLARGRGELLTPLPPLPDCVRYPRRSCSASSTRSACAVIPTRRASFPRWSGRTWAISAAGCITFSRT